ncbi:MAG: hypothetical protein MOB07_28900, partial [Acidobacteria bacterium]|nr:hypothetical protein [Acidobacteriota bacterium]
AGRAFWGVAGHASMAAAQSAGAFSATGNMKTARFNHTATLLANGKVLVAGGYNNSAELYDPATGTWSSTGNLNIARGLHTATLLPNGKVLVAGGPNDPVTLDSAELYDPATGTWSITGNLNTGRYTHTATLLPNGKVLVAGTGNCGGNLSGTELYDPATGTWSSTADLNTGRYSHTATLLPSGKVLVAGGRNCWVDLNSAELYDPATGTWSYTGNHSSFHTLHTATLLVDGKVLVAGAGGFFDRAELYDPTTETWSLTGKLNLDRENHSATLLPNGKVLIAGGNWDGEAQFNSAEVYDPTTDTWSSTANLNIARWCHTSTLLPNGKVLVAGGGFSSATCELFDLGLPQAGTVASVSAASFSLTGLASEAITTSFGPRLATATQAATTASPPTSLAGTTVNVKDSAGAERFAPLFFVSPTQVNYQIPPGTTAGAAAVTITSGDGTVSTGVALVKAIAPGLFTANGNGQGMAAALALRVKADGTQSYEPIAQFDAAQNRFVARPLDLGPEGEQVYLVLFGTGIRHRSSLSSVIATIGGAYAEVSFAGAQGAFVGSDQINVLVPRSLAGRGEIDVLLTVEAQMANAVQVNVK